MNNILVTGATGFIGRHLVNTLLMQNYQLRVLVREFTDTLPAEVEQVKGDLTQPETLATLCVGIDTVFHLAGYAHAFKEGQAGFVEKHQNINYAGTTHLFNFALQQNVARFIYFSSVKAVADSAQKIDEHWQLNPNTPYGIAKRNAENYLLTNAAKHAMHVCILRPALVYGPHCKGNLYAMLKAIDKNIFLPVPPVANCRSMVSLDDICQAARLAATHASANGKIYFVTDAQDYSTYDMFFAMRKALGKSIPKWHLPMTGFKLLGIAGDLLQKILRRRLPFNSESMRKLFDSAAYDSRLIQSELGFKPADNLKTCLPSMIAAYRQR